MEKLDIKKLYDYDWFIGEFKREYSKITESLLEFKVLLYGRKNIENGRGEIYAQEKTGAFNGIKFEPGNLYLVISDPKYKMYCRSFLVYKLIEEKANNKNKD